MREDSKNIFIAFNSALETGLRSVCILAVDHTMVYDLQQLLALDHLVVHSGDVEKAPSSLHPKVSPRNGELLVRRPIIERGLLLMESKNLVEKIATDEGFFYRATDFSEVFVNSLTNEYMTQLYDRATWAVQAFRENGTEFFNRIFDIAFDRWTSEFQFEQLSVGER